MGHQHESVNHSDFDVIRSTQFDEDFARMVRVLCAPDFKLHSSCALGI